MATGYTKTSLPSGGLATTRYKVPALTHTPVNGLTGASKNVVGVRIDARLNTKEDVFLRMYNNAAPTVGTTAEHACLPCLAGQDITYLSPRGTATFGTDLSIACTKEKAGDAAGTAPSGTVDVYILVN